MNHGPMTWQDLSKVLRNLELGMFNILSRHAGALVLVDVDRFQNNIAIPVPSVIENHGARRAAIGYILAIQRELTMRLESSFQYKFTLVGAARDAAAEFGGECIAWDWNYTVFGFDTDLSAVAFKCAYPDILEEAA